MLYYKYKIIKKENKMKKNLFVNFLDSPAQVVKFVIKNKLKKVISVNYNIKINQYEVWFYTSKKWQDI